MIIIDIYGYEHMIAAEHYSYAWECGKGFVLEFDNGNHYHVSPETRIAVQVAFANKQIANN